MRDGIEHMRQMGIDGLILITAERMPTDVARDGLPNIPIVAMDSDYRADRLNVNVDNAGAAALATQHLIDLGHQKILHITGETAWAVGRQRREGFERTMQAAGLDPIVVEGDWQIETGHAIGSSFDLAQVTAVFCANDGLALGLLKACRERGIGVPEDLSVVGFDDVPEAAYFAPPLTTIRQDFDRMGKQAIRVLLAELAGEQPADNPLLRLHLVTRDSTAPPSRL